MKKMTAMTLGLVISTVAMPALATKAQREQLTQCKSELRAIYGKGSHLKLSSITNRGKMRIKTLPEGGESMSVMCWKDKSGTLQLTDRKGVALIDTDRNAISRVTTDK